MSLIDTRRRAVLFLQIHQSLGHDRAALAAA